VNTKKECEVRMVFPPMDKKQIKHLHNAEIELSKIGVSFDTGHNIEDDGKIGESDWELDWSLEGAKIYFIKTKENK